MSDICFLSATELARRIRLREVSAVEVMEAVEMEVAEALQLNSPIMVQSSKLMNKTKQQLKQDKPQLEDDQRKGRAIWWDRAQDLDTAERNRDSRVPQQAYVYQTKTGT